MRNAIRSLKFRVRINGDWMTLFDARDAGLVDVHYDKLWGLYSYRVIATGEVVSFYSSGFSPVDWSDWYREAVEMRSKHIDQKNSKLSQPTTEKQP